jgi:hypothetical protein
MQEIKKRRPHWRFQFYPNDSISSRKTLKRSKSNKSYFSKIGRLKNFLIINHILCQIRIKGNYEENSHLFEALKGTKKEGRDSELK